jgi:hypothetical protein
MITTQTDLGDQLYTFVGKTLVDITNTDIITEYIPYRHKQRNWEVLKQVLGLRAQIVVLNSPSVTEIDLKNLNFGSDFKGQQYVWTFTFAVEFEHVFSNSESDVGILYKDIINVPIITGLSETVKFKSPVFNISNTQRNIIFERKKV